MPAAIKPMLKDNTCTADLFVDIYERGIQLLKPGGQFAFITSPPTPGCWTHCAPIRIRSATPVAEGITRLAHWRLGHAAVTI